MKPKYLDYPLVVSGSIGNKLHPSMISGRIWAKIWVVLFFITLIIFAIKPGKTPR